MESDPALIRPDCIVILDPPAALYADVVIIVFPAHPEGDYPVGFSDPAQYLRLMIFLLVQEELEYIPCNFAYSLNEFGLARIALFNTCHKAF